MVGILYMLTFRVRVTLEESQFDSIRKDLEYSENINDELKSHIYQQIIDQIRNINTNYY